MRLSEVVLSTLRGAAGAALVVVVGCTEPAPAAPPIAAEPPTVAAPAPPAPAPPAPAVPPAPAPTAPDPAPAPPDPDPDGTNAAPTPEGEDAPEGTEAIATKTRPRRPRTNTGTPPTGLTTLDPGQGLENAGTLTGIGLSTGNGTDVHAGCGRG